MALGIVAQSLDTEGAKETPTKCWFADLQKGRFKCTIKQ